MLATILVKSLLIWWLKVSTIHLRRNTPIDSSIMKFSEREYFDEVDEDKNGKLDVSEVGQLIDPRDECIIEALVEQFIFEADADKDKNITFEGWFN